MDTKTVIITVDFESENNEHVNQYQFFKSVETIEDAYIVWGEFMHNNAAKVKAFGKIESALFEVYQNSEWRKIRKIEFGF